MFCCQVCSTYIVIFFKTNSICIDLKLNLSTKSGSFQSRCLIWRWKLADMSTQLKLYIYLCVCCCCFYFNFLFVCCLESCRVFCLSGSFRVEVCCRSHESKQVHCVERRCCLHVSREKNIFDRCRKTKNKMMNVLLDQVVHLQIYPQINYLLLSLTSTRQLNL